MRVETRAALNEIESARLYHHVGEPLAPEHVLVSSWEEAAEYSGDLTFQNDLLDRANALTEELVSRDRHRYAVTWNATVDELRPRILKKTAAAIKSADVPKPCRQSVAATTTWCLIHYCMEREFGDVVQVDEFGRLWKLFTAGHFPCGIQYVRDERMLVVC
jgi:hypothetical protein